MKHLVFKAYDPDPEGVDLDAKTNVREIGRITYQHHEIPVRRWYLRKDVQPWSITPQPQSEKDLDEVFVLREKQIYFTLLGKKIETYREPYKLQRSRRHGLEAFVSVAGIDIPLGFCVVQGRENKV